MPTIPGLTIEATLKRRLRRHLHCLGFGRTATGSLEAAPKSKNLYRRLHAEQRAEVIQRESAFLEKAWPKVRRAFADGREVEPELIEPLLLPVSSGTWESDLFRLARLTWSIPTSNGFGRRMRFLVWDKGANRLMGLLALGDPVFNLSVRDKYIGWDHSDRKERLVNVMDAFIVGAVPPYNTLLCGKLVACLLRSTEIANEFKSRYGSQRGTISGKVKSPRLAIVTTSSALGRSSLYNRLKLDGITYLQPIGYTTGWGHFHIPLQLFEDMRKFLREKGHRYADGHQFGQGPNWKLRVLRETLKELGVNENILCHGLKREVFCSELAANALECLRKPEVPPDYLNLKDVQTIGIEAKERWILRRAVRRPEYAQWTRDNIRSLLSTTRRAAQSGEQATLEMEN